MGWRLKQIALALAILAITLGVALGDIYLWRLVV